ncbi:MAG: MBL fold metallo-hydrolase, partial [Christensenellales bacterium]
MKELLPDIYTHMVPLPGSPLKWINSYLVEGKDRFLLIDTAFNMKECETSLLSFLDEMDAALENTDIFITHTHVDHCGLANRFKRPTNRVMASTRDAGLINAMVQPSYWERIAEHNELAGVPDGEKLSFRDHVAYRYKPEAETEFHTLNTGDSLSYGRYTFQVMDLSGHSPGQA